MSCWIYVLRSLRYHWRENAAVALGVAAATAVLVGALVVGDSVRGSLLAITLERLGKIDRVLVAEHFFRAALADELESTSGFSDHFSGVVPAIVFSQGTAESRKGEKIARASGVTVLGVDESFWNLGKDSVRPEISIGENEVVLNASLAKEMGIVVGDSITLRLQGGNQAPAESPLGEKSNRVRSLVELKVIAVIPAQGLGRFSLSANQESSRNSYVLPITIQRALKLEGNRVNALLLAGKAEQLDAAEAKSASVWLDDAFRPRLSDYGLRLSEVRRTYKPVGGDEQVAFEYLNVSTDRLLFDDRLARCLEQALGGDRAQPVLTYLANSIAKVERDQSENGVAGENSIGATQSKKKKPAGIPYSTVTALDPTPGLPELRDVNGQALPRLAAEEIVLTSWAAADLNAQQGDLVELTYFEPETTHGVAKSAKHRFRIVGITPLVEPNAPYTRRKPAEYRDRPASANDPDLTPTVPGITDAESMARWDAPFALEYDRIRSQDDDFWERHRTTPKAFVSLEMGRQLWGSRFGDTSTYRLPIEPGNGMAEIEQRILEQLRRDQWRLGSGMMPLKEQGLAASKGSTPFDVLFLSLSAFVIVAALILVALLFRLAFEPRAREAGVLLAIGVARRRLAMLMMIESLVVATVGAIGGAPLGLAYAATMIYGLNSWWQGAVGTNFLRYYWSWPSIATGMAAGVGMSLATVAWCIRSMSRTSERRLLAGSTSEVADGLPRDHRLAWIGSGLVTVGAILLSVLAGKLGGELQAAAFVGSGMGLLVAMLILVWIGLHALRGNVLDAQRWPLWRMARRNAGRNRGRSMATIGLVAAATFLIVAMGAFRQSPTESGVGGCELFAESDRPVFGDWRDAKTRRELLRQSAELCEGATILPLRLHPGDDASCRNLYQAARPRMLGVPEQFVSHYDREQAVGFQWAGSAAASAEEKRNPWRMLLAPALPGEPAPVVLDENTALYSLHLYGGVGETFSVPLAEGGTAQLRVVGLLSNSVLQGSLFLAERDFLRLFPREPGYRFFLIQTSPEQMVDVANALETEMADFGMNVEVSRERLGDMLAVQNTYLATFQSLGTLGLLLGAFGLAAVQLRNVVERRGELALLQAVGMCRRKLKGMVLLEHTWLLFAGMGTGSLAALMAVVPHAWAGNAAGSLTFQLLPVAVVFGLGWGVGFLVVRKIVELPLIAALRGE